MGSYALAAAMAGGEVRLTKGRADLITALTDRMIEAGVEIEPTDDGLIVLRLCGEVVPGEGGAAAKPQAGAGEAV